MKQTVGVDVGGTRIKAGLVDASGRVMHQTVLWLDAADKSPEGLLARISEAVETVSGDTPVASVGVGIPGVVSRAEGLLMRSPNFPLIKRLPVKAALQRRLGRPVMVDNDANCVIGGEALRGAGVGLDNLLGFTIGTGVGGAILLGGKLWRGVQGMAGELGHMVVDPEGAPCGCGSRGCLETFCGVVGLRNLCRSAPIEGVDPTSNELPRLLSEAASAGDQAARAHFSASGRALGRAVGSLVNVFNVKDVVIAGGVAPAFVWMEEACRRELVRVAFPEIADGVAFHLGTLGDTAGMVGAGLQGSL